METTNAIQQIYIGLLGRAADQEGLQYWTDEIEAGTLTLEQLRANIVEEQPEYEATFGGQTRAQVVSQLYANLFNRAPDSEGLQYWVNGEGASVNIDQLVLALVNGAAAADTLVLDNRTEVANYYTEQLGAEGSFDADLAAAVIADVDGTRASVTQAKASVDNGDIVAPTPNEGNTFTLTTAIAENVVGTDANDTFNGVLGQTFNTGDVVDGRGGVDTLNLFGDDTNTGTGATVTDNVTALPGGAQVKNVEVVNLISTATNGTAAQAVLASVDASRFEGAQQIWQVGAASSVTKATNAQTVGLRDTSGTVNAAFVGTEANIALDDVIDESRVNIEGAKVETVNISGSVVNADPTDTALAQLDLGSEVEGSLAKLETINLAMTSDVQVNTYADAFANATTLNASESTGDLTMGFTDQADDAIKLETITLGSGDDTLQIYSANLGAEEVAINGGEGADTLAVILGNAGDDTALTLTGGAGGDTFAFAGGNINQDHIDDEAFTNSVTIADFGNGTDVLNLNGFTGFTAESAVTNALAGLAEDATLFDAVSAVATLVENGGTNVTETAQFEFGGNTYVYQDSNTGTSNDAGLSTGDTLIELTGGVSLDDNNVISTYGVE